MVEFIFYTTKGFSQAPNGKDIENCQMLGRAYGSDKDEALQALCNANPWIEENDYDKEKIVGAKLA